jgi:hypothetical protein
MVMFAQLDITVPLESRLNVLLELSAIKMVFPQILCNASKDSTVMLALLECVRPRPLTIVIGALLVTIAQLVHLLLSNVLLVITLTLEV